MEQAAAAALRDPALQLLAVHFGEPDDAAHLSGVLESAGGAGGGPYLEAVRRADVALGRLAAAAGPQTAVLITSDHGVTDRGGHAGPEPEVLTIPVVTAGPGMPRGPLGELRQRDLRRLVETALGHAPPARTRHTPRPVRPHWNGAALLLAGLATAAAAAHLGAVHTGRVRGWGPMVLDACFWTALALLLLGWRGAALAVVLGALAVGVLAIRPAQGHLSNALPSPIFMALAAGTLAGALRLADGAWTAQGVLPPGGSGAVALLAACLVAAALGASLGWAITPRRGETAAALAAGVAAALVPALCARLAGDTVSLSTLDVRLAFRLAEGPLGLTGAALAATFRAVLPALALAAGLAPALRRAGAPAAGRFYAGLGAGLCGQALAAALLLALRPLETAAVALGTGQLVRLFGEMSFLFLACAAATALRQAHLAAAGAGEMSPSARLSAAPR